MHEGQYSQLEGEVGGGGRWSCGDFWNFSSRSIFSKDIFHDLEKLTSVVSC